MRKLTTLLVFLICVLAAQSAWAWSAQARIMILEDALKFSPTRLKNLVDAQSAELPLLVELANEQKRRDLKLLYDEAVRTLAVYKISNEKKVKVLLELSIHVLDATSPSSAPQSAQQLNKSTSSFQAEWDGQDYIQNIAGRLENTQKALGPFRERFDAYLERRQERYGAAETVGTCYHVAVNDLADLFTSAWRDATGDTAAWLTSKGDRIWHPPQGGILQLPRGFDPIPTLGEYYDEIDNSFVEARIRRGRGVSPPPSSFYIFEIPITLVSSEGADRIRDWKKTHRPDELEPNPIPEMEKIEAPTEAKPEAAPPRRSPGKIRVRDLGEEKALGPGEVKPDTDNNEEISGAAGMETKSPRKDDDVAQVIQEAYPQVQAAYKNYLTHGDKGGKVMAEFTITPDGEVKDLLFSLDEIGDNKLNSDLTFIFKRLVFAPGSRGEVHVKYPLIFQKGKPKETGGI
jgi:hypothetical protein